MTFEIDDILTLSDNREFKIVNAVTIDNLEYLYLKNTQIDQYTIVKVVGNKIFNLTSKEMSLVIENLYRSRWVY